MTNPLLNSYKLPPFDLIEADLIEPAVKTLLAQSQEQIQTLLKTNPSSWAELVPPMEAIEEPLSQLWSGVSHLHSVKDNPDLREAYNNCLPMLSEYSTWLGQNQKLYQAFLALESDAAQVKHSQVQNEVVKQSLRDFRLSGVGLNEADKAQYAQLMQKLSQLTCEFSQNVLDATGAWSLLIEQESDLNGLPDMALQSAKAAAQAEGKTGYLLTLQYPSMNAVMTYCEDRSLRQTVYTAYATRASDQGPQAGQFDNTQLMQAIVKLRGELANLLGFDSYADYSLATKMAQSSEQVLAFLTDLAQQSRPGAEADLAELAQFAKESYGVLSLEAWDIAYYSEKLKQSRYALSEEELRPYFPLEKVLQGLFALVNRLYGIEVQALEDFVSYDPSVRFYQLSYEGKVLAQFYLDPFARAQKRSGAWMDECRVRRVEENGTVQLPVAYLVCNFTAPVGDKPALLLHDEVVTLFHEFGHGLHHMLTQVDYASVSGIRGVPWDGVELPSQLMENWCWEAPVLAMISGHYETGEPLPQSLLEKLQAAKNFQAGLFIVRQVEFALFDFRLHAAKEGSIEIQALLDAVRQEVAVLIPPAFNRFAQSFSHIFAGGYAAGYYSYLWAEVLSADAFAKFEEQGILNQKTGKAFLQALLEKGGSCDFMQAFIDFRGRKPSQQAFLRHKGLVHE